MSLKRLSIRNVWRVVAATPLVLGATVSPTLCGQAGDPAPASLTGSLERHFTTNALDSDRAVADWYTLLRGSLARSWGDSDANASLGAQLQATRHDRVSIEDDRTLALSAAAFRRFGGLELRGTLTYTINSDGDDLDIGALDIGTRALKQTAAAQVEIGLALDKATTLVVQGADSMEWTGATRFENDVLAPVRLDPRRNRLQVGARLTRTAGVIAFGGSASALLMTVEELGSPPIALSLGRYGLRGELAIGDGKGAKLGIAFGAEMLRGAQDIYCRVRPAWEVTLVKPLTGGFDVSGSWFARYETDDTDDPLASWVERAQLSLGSRIGTRLKLDAGIAWQVKENLLFENEERGRGLYAEATWLVTRSTTAVLRVDVAKTFKTVIDSHENTVDLFVGWQAKI